MKKSIKFGIIVNGQSVELPEDVIKAIMPTITLLSKQFVSTTETTVETPVAPVISTPKVYEHTDQSYDDFVWVIKDNQVRYTRKDGSYLYNKAIRQALNARLKKAGFVYTDKVWELNKGNKRDLVGAKKFVQDSSPVTPDEINAILDKWTTSAAKRHK